MPACRRNFKGALCIFLPFYILEVQKLLCFVLRLPDGRGIDRRLAGQVRGQLPDVLYAVDGQTASQRGLARVILRDVQLLIAEPLRGQRHRQDAGNGAQRPLQTQLTEERAAFLRKLYLLGGSQNRQEDRQIVERAGFLRTRRSEVHDDAADREPEAAVFDRGAHAFARLLDGRVRQTDQIERRKPRTDVAFRLHLISVDAGQAEREHFTEHLHPSAFFFASIIAHFASKTNRFFKTCRNARQIFERFPPNSKSLSQI